MGTNQTPNQLAVREDFAGTEIEMLGETAAAAVAARQKAMVEASYIIAMKRPRDWETVRQRVLLDCKRPAFAKVAKWSRQFGGEDKSGPSIRFVEAALRSMGNIAVDVTAIYEDERKRIVRVYVCDLENNMPYSQEIVVDKSVERSSDKGRIVLGERLNAKGYKVFIVQATDDELLSKQNQLASKARRSIGLQLIPGDITANAMRLVDETVAKEVADDPDKTKRNIIDSFCEIGVSTVDLQGYVGHTLDRVTPAELVKLRQIYTAVSEGDVTWEEVMESRGPAPVGTQEQAADVAARKIAELTAQQEATKQANAEAVQSEPAKETTNPTPEPPKPVTAGLKFYKK